MVTKAVAGIIDNSVGTGSHGFLGLETLLRELHKHTYDEKKLQYLSARKAALAAGKGRMRNRRAFPDFSDWDDPDGYAGHVYSSNTITEVSYDLFFKKENLVER